MVQTDGLAHEMGIRAGDVVLRLGDEDVNSTDDFDQARMNYPPGLPVTIVLWRDARTLELRLDRK
ncbi:MAG: PDZ domain-containing protein [Bryobacterales bacterium]|nr:PDZ domain-containing protein [Bryobacterales bacterium]